MESSRTRTHRLSNREKLQQAFDLILSASHDEFFGPTEFEYMTEALDALETVLKFPLNAAELHAVRVAALDAATGRVKGSVAVREP